MNAVGKASLLILAFTGTVKMAETGNCQAKIYSCIKMVRPVLNDVRYMFPTSLSDVDTMCKMWSRFVDCVRRYMTSCSTDDQRSKFNKAVGRSVDTVHAICSSDRHQREYLESAHCVRRVSVESCGRYYLRLVTQVSNREAEDTHICCAYGQFKGCVSAPLLRNCGLKVHALLDHSLSYLVSTCSSTFYPLNRGSQETNRTPVKTIQRYSAMSYKCPTAPPPLPMTGPETTQVLSTTEEETSPTSTTLMSTVTPRTIIYTLPPTLGSRTSGATSGPDGFFVVMWISLASWIQIRFTS